MIPRPARSLHHHSHPDAAVVKPVVQRPYIRTKRLSGSIRQLGAGELHIELRLVYLWVFEFVRLYCLLAGFFDLLREREREMGICIGICVNIVLWGDLPL